MEKKIAKKYLTPNPLYGPVGFSALAFSLYWIDAFVAPTTTYTFVFEDGSQKDVARDIYFQYQVGDTYIDR